MVNEYLMREAFKYELLRDVLFNNSAISWSGDLRFDDEKICNLLKIIELERYEGHLEDLKEREDNGDN